MHAAIFIPIFIPIPFPIPCILPLRGTCWHNGDENDSFVPALPRKLDLVQLNVSIHLSFTKAQGKSLQSLSWCITLCASAVFAYMAAEILAGDTAEGLLQY